MPHTKRLVCDAVCLAWVAFLRCCDAPWRTVDYPLRHYVWHVHGRAHELCVSSDVFRTFTRYASLSRDPTFKGLLPEGFPSRDALFKSVLSCHYFLSLTGGFRPPVRLLYCLLSNSDTSQLTLSFPIGNRQFSVQKNLLDTNVLVGRLHPIAHTEPVTTKLIQRDVLEV